MAYSLLFKVNNEPWNKGMIIGPKPPLKLKEVWAIRVRLQLSCDVRNLALFNLAIDSKLRACDLVGLRVCDVTQGYKVVQRATVMQKKTKRPVQLLLGHTKLESTVRYLGIELDADLEIAEQTEV